MNKYQEAFDHITETLVDCGRTKDLPGETILLDQRELNLLQKLVDKTVPKKPVLGESWKDCCKTIYDEDGFINASLCVCPNCGKYTIYDWEYSRKFKCCTNCMQTIDWSDEHD